MMNPYAGNEVVLYASVRQLYERSSSNAAPDIRVEQRSAPHFLEFGQHFIVRLLQFRFGRANSGDIALMLGNGVQQESLCLCNSWI
jgi:hypothetical protein